MRDCCALLVAELNSLLTCFEQGSGARPAARSERLDVFSAGHASMGVSGRLCGMAAHGPIGGFSYPTSLSRSVPETQTHPIFLVFFFMLTH